jgi:succinoglycan biosynthesis transport protein ExoP
MENDARLLPSGGGHDLPILASSFQPPAPYDPWQRLFATIRHSKWLVIGVTVLGTAVSVVATRFLRTSYDAHAVLWVEVPDPRNPNPLSTGMLGVSGWVDLLRSHAVLDDVVREQRLNVTVQSDEGDSVVSTLRLDSTFTAGTYELTVAADASWKLKRGDGSLVDQGKRDDAIGRAEGFVWAPPREGPAALRPGETIDFTVQSYYDAALGLGSDLRITTDIGSNFIQLALRGTDRAGVAAIVNGVAERFVLVATDLKRRKQSELATILGEQLGHARSTLTEAEDALRAFRARSAPLLTQGTTGITSHPAPTDPSVSGYLDLQSQLTAARRDRQAMQRILGDAGKSGESLDMLSFIEPVQKSEQLSGALHELTARQADIRALRYRYTDDNPEVRRVANQITELEQSIIPTLARAVIGELSTRERELNRLIGTASGNLRDLPALLLEDARLSRDAQSAEAVLTRIDQRYGEARLAEVSSVADARILDPAAPPEVPLASLARIFIALAMLGSFGLGVGGAIIRERIDPTVFNAGQVTQGFGLSILGAVPHLAAHGGKGSAQAIDALRGIRLNVMHSYGSAGPIVFTVSSPGMGDGKSFVSVNLALAFADAGFKTLLVDGDIRRGRLQRVFDAPRKPGLTDVLSNATPFTTALRSTGRDNLTFLACGSRTRTGPELLGSPAMPGLLVRLREQFSVIVVDSPPLAAGIEPYVLGTLTGNLLLVLRLGSTDRSLAEGKLDAISRLPIRVLGAVLNGVRSPDVYRRYAYALEGYELRDEETTWADAHILRDRS